MQPNRALRPYIIRKPIFAKARLPHPACTRLERGVRKCTCGDLLCRVIESRDERVPISLVLLPPMIRANKILPLRLTSLYFYRVPGRVLNVASNAASGLQE